MQIRSVPFLRPLLLLAFVLLPFAASATAVSTGAAHVGADSREIPLPLSFYDFFFGVCNETYCPLYFHLCWESPFSFGDFFDSDSLGDFFLVEHKYTGRKHKMYVKQVCEIKFLTQGAKPATG